MVLRDVHMPTLGNLRGTGALQVCETEGPEWEFTLELSVLTRVLIRRK